MNRWLTYNSFMIFQVRGEIEIWLSSFEKQMVEALRHELKSAFEGTLSSFHISNDWMSELVPAQILMLKCQALWCQGTERAIDISDNSTTLLSWIVGHKTNVFAQCIAIRECTAPLQRFKFSAILTQEVHHRDILDRLEQSKVNDSKDFQWQMCMRCYISEKATKCQFRQIASTLLYTFEYWGATSRLVITALTEKCYLTLTSALHLMLGGAPFGPAGTGKTETTKDLSKSLGRQCIVFNCGVRNFMQQSHIPQFMSLLVFEAT